MRKQCLPIIIGLTSLMVLQYQSGLGQEYALLQVNQNHANTTKELKVVLASLEKKFGVYFTFESQVIRNKYLPKEAKITQNLEETLDNILSPLNLKFKKISEKYYTIFPKGEPQTEKQTSSDQGLQSSLTSKPDSFFPTLSTTKSISDLKAVQIMVSGTVTDESNAALPGVNVLEKGTTNGTATDASGRFTLNVENEQSILVFSFIGYENIEVAVGSKSVIDISLTPSTNSLQEVVVIGYGSVERKDLTGSVASVGSGEIKQMAATRLDQALIGKMAGVQVKPVSGEPGAPQQIRIRGIGSISAGAGPLYVVDGYPVGSIQTINPNDIES